MSELMLVRCPHCDPGPAALEGEGRLYLWPSHPAIFKRICQTAESQGLPHGAAPDGRSLYMSLPARGSEDLLGRLCGALGAEELESTRALVVRGRRLPAYADIPRVTTLQRLAARLRTSWLHAMLREDRLLTYFQPIVSCEDPTRVFAHEALLRGLDESGALVPPLAIFSAAEEVRLRHKLDLHARRCAIRCAARHQLQGQLFINFNPAADSCKDAESCLDVTLKAVNEAGFDHGRITFEVVESERIKDMKELARFLDLYRCAGFHIALDDLGAGYASLNALHQLRPDYIKLDMELIRDIHLDPYKAQVASKLLELASSLGVETVAEGIERPEELAWLRENGATYVQGFFLARPAELPRPARLPQSA